MKNFILGMVMIISIGVIVYGAYYLGSKSQKPLPGVSPSPTVAQEPSAEPTASPTAAPTTQGKSDEELIREALYQKNSWPQSLDAKVNLSKNDGTYAGGTVSADGGGGYVFAKKTGGEWVIVADGNGIISCASIKQYPDFPAALIPECYNEVTGKSEQR